MPNKISVCKVKALKTNNTVEHDVNSVLEDFKIITQLWLRMLPKPRPINTLSTLLLNISNILFILIWDLFPKTQDSSLTISKAAQGSKAVGLDNLSRHFLKDGAKFLPKSISDFCNLSIISEKCFVHLQKLYAIGLLKRTINSNLICPTDLFCLI